MLVSAECVDIVALSRSLTSNTGNRFQFIIAGADSLSYLSVEGLKRAVQFKMKITNPKQSGHCTACLTGEYPGGIPEELSW